MKSGHPYIWARYREPIIGGFRGKNLFCFLSENECLDGMELVLYILYIFLRHKHPVIELSIFLHF